MAAAIGVKTGSVVAGVVGTRRFTYDFWGNTVNLAQRLEETCEPGRINIAGSTLHHVQGLFETEPRGKVAVKHMDALEMYFLDALSRILRPMQRDACPTSASGRRAGWAEPAASRAQLGSRVARSCSPHTGVSQSRCSVSSPRTMRK